MEYKNIKKLTMFVNTFILLIVIGLMFFYIWCNATFLVYYSIPVILVYLAGYVIINKNMLYEYVNMVYIMITIYMGITTICMGYNYGFHLYSMSLIPIIFYTDYIAYKINKKKLNPMAYSIFIIIVNLSSTLYSSYRGPVYSNNKTFALIFLITNALSVFFFIVFYTHYMVKEIIVSEEKLEQIAHVDRLTGLYNRHYMIQELERISQPLKFCVAMVDIDDFKKINDKYGHNAGDYVLKSLSEIMKTNCEKAIISRWGGEEFLILNSKEDDETAFFEKLRKSVEQYEFEYENQKIKVSVTIGVADNENNQSIDKWIQNADQKLYKGKKSGKNKVVI